MKAKRISALTLASCLLLAFCSKAFAIPSEAAADDGKVVTLRVCNWEEYIDQGDWDDSEVIDLESGDILGKNSLVDDFEE